MTREAFEELLRCHAQGDVVLSLYLDLDPHRFATVRARISEIDSLLDGAHREVEAGDRSHGDRQVLRDAVEHARVLLTRHSYVKGARALALFLCATLELATVLRLPHPVASAFAIADAPFIEPLTELMPAGKVCVALVDERSARIMRGSAAGLRTELAVRDDVHGGDEKDGLRRRYQRAHHEDVKAHLRHVAWILRRYLRLEPYDRLLIACTAQLWPRLVEELHPDVHALLHNERLSLDVGEVRVEDLLDATNAALAEEDGEHSFEALARFREFLGRNDGVRAASGLEDVLAALVERRVDTLLFQAGLAAPGVLCLRCGLMATGGDHCPVDGSSLERRPNIVEDALRSATNQSAQVLSVREPPALAAFGGIAATLRF